MVKVSKWFGKCLNNDFFISAKVTAVENVNKKLPKSFSKRCSIVYSSSLNKSIKVDSNGKSKGLRSAINEQTNGQILNEHLEVSLTVSDLSRFWMSKSCSNDYKVCKARNVPKVRNFGSKLGSKRGFKVTIAPSCCREGGLKVLRPRKETCCNYQLLMQCGDIESNPGPLPFVPPAPPHSQVRATTTADDGLGGGDAVGDQQGEDRQDRQVQQGQGRGKVTSPRCELQVLTYNIRGLSDSKKTRHIVNMCYKLSKKAENSFFMLQETFVLRLDLLKYLWRGEYHLTPGTGNSKGCVTLVTAPYKIIHADDFENRAHVIVLTKNSLDKAELILVNVYAPNGYDEDKVTFFEELVDKVSENVTAYNCDNVIMAGDLNLVFSEDEVKNRQYPRAEKRTAVRVNSLLVNMGLEDGWKSSPTRQFTWSSNRTGEQAFSTLDRVLFTKDRYKVINISSDWSLSLSDHAAVTASLKINRTDSIKASQISRLDPRLLLDEEGRQHLDERFRELTGQSMDGWSPHVRLEFFKMCIRTAANDAIGKVKAKIRDTEAILNKDINDVIEELSEASLHPDRKLLLMNKLDDLRQIKRCLVEKVGNRLEQRSARKWYNEGELSNKYFFNLLNRRTNDEVTVILDDNGAEITESKDIEEKIRFFYKELYETVIDENEVANDDLFRNVQQVPAEGSARMREDLTLSELETTLRTCSDSAPGPDGIPYSFIKHFWADFGPVLLASWKHSLETGELPPSHKVSYLRLIPKEGKDTRIIPNLRPITLSNTDHKLITKTYASKLTKVVAECIGGEQTAYIPGRLINDNLRSMLMTIDLANVDETIDGMVVSLDAKKAFDSVSHNYIRRCLKAFGLESLVPIFNVLYKDLRSNIILNGKVINGYSILRGVKQGDALSCILFIMCMEPLIRNVKSNADVVAISSNQLNINVPKVYSFADDVTVIARTENRSLQAVFNEYEAFSKESGLVLNAEKTELLCFGRRRAGGVAARFNVRYNGANHNLESTNRIKVNGIFLSENVVAREDFNVGRSIEAMERLLRSWSTRRLTLIGRILIIKTFALSKMIYLMQTLTLSEKSYKSFTNVVFKFLWNRNFDAARAPERLKRSIMYTPLTLGGFGMVDIKAMGDSLDLRSYGRLLKSTHPFMSQIRDKIRSGNFLNLRFDGEVDRKSLRSLTLFNAARNSALNWPLDILLRDVNFSTMVANQRLRELLSATGKQSIPYLSIHRRIPGAKVGQVTLREFQSVERYLIYPLQLVIKEIILRRGNAQNVRGNMDENDIFPTKGNQFLPISTLSSKALRVNQIDDEDQVICIYKLGLIMNPGEVRSWTGRLKKLTSTRHKNILLRAVHGDIFSNARLARFGLRQEAGCSNCREPNESIEHKIKDCPKARLSWLELERVKRELGLSNLSDLSMENLIGAKDKVNKIELALQAELIHKLTSSNESYCPIALVRRVVKIIGYSERLGIQLKARFNDWLKD